jgi:hypothetical protein
MKSYSKKLLSVTLVFTLSSSLSSFRTRSVGVLRAFAALSSSSSLCCFWFCCCGLALVVVVVE